MMEFTFNGLVRHGFGFYNPNHAAALICAIMPFLWGWKKYKYISYLLNIFFVCLLCMTYSRTGFIVLSLEFIIYHILAKNIKMKQLLLALIPILVIITFSGIFYRFSLDNSILNRPKIWIAGVQLFAKNPFGVGLGNSGLLVSNLLLEDINCRTLINSHLTILVESGLFIGFLWCGIICYAILIGIKKLRSWCAFVGLCISAASATIFDFSLLLDFQNFGHLPLINFCLSYILFGSYCGLCIYLIWGNIKVKEIIISSSAAGLLLIICFLFYSKNTPRIYDNCIVQGNQTKLILYDESWRIKDIILKVPRDYIIPLKATFIKKSVEEVILFGNAAEYGSEFPESKLIYVNPPEITMFPENTIKILQPKYSTFDSIYPIEYY